jgi:hypothetical protein
VIYPIAYIGPGAGFAFLGSFLAILLSVVLTTTSVLIWPFRAAWHFFTCLRSRRKSESSEADLSGAGWSRSRAYGKVHGGRQAAESFAADATGRLPPLADYVPRALPCGVVHVCDRRESGAA